MKLVVDRVTRDADDGLHGYQQIARDGSVGVVADLAILGGGWVLVDPGPHDVLMATGTELILVTRAHSGVFVRIMAGHAAHSALGHRVVGRVAEAGPDIGMAFYAELRRRVHVGEG